MTTRNLNTTWRDIVFKQYAADLEEAVAFPVRYLIYTPQWKRDIYIHIPSQISLQTFRQSIFTFFRALHTTADPTWSDDNISIEPRKSGATSEDVDQDADLPAPGGGNS